MGVRFDSDLHVAGSITCEELDIPAGSLVDADVAAGAAISATKLMHQHSPNYSQPNTTATSETRILHTVYGATGTITAFKAGSIVLNIGAATVTVDLRKNGTTVLTGVITLDTANTAYTPEAATILSASVVAGDVLSVVITATAGGGTLATGFYCYAIITEAGA